jgi:hypothetical protein
VIASNSTAAADAAAAAAADTAADAAIQSVRSASHLQSHSRPVSEIHPLMFEIKRVLDRARDNTDHSKVDR